MNDHDLINSVSIISFIIVIVFLFFAFFLLTVKTENKTRNGLLAAFLIVTAIDISAFFYYKFITLPVEIEILRSECISFLKIPLLYLYVLSLVYTDFRLKPKHLLHGILFLLSVIILVPCLLTANTSVQNDFIQHLSEQNEIKFLRFSLTIQSWAYIIALVMLLVKYKKLLFENYASNISLSNYRWLLQFNIFMIVLSFITQAKDFLKLTSYTDLTNAFTVLMLAGGLIFIFWVVLSALYNPDLFRGIDARLQTVEKLVADTAADNIQHNRETTIENQDKIKQLKEYMETEEPFLEPSLTVQDLANQMKMPVRDLSILINHTLNQHFFDFVNGYRIEKAMNILKDPKRKELTILEILYKSGFNSKSSFHTAFKKQTDLTPTQFRKTHAL